MAEPGARPSRTDLLRACVRRKRSSVPVAAGLALALIAPGAGVTWMLAPLLMLGGAASFVYDLTANRALRDQVARDLADRAAALEDDGLVALGDGMPDGDLHAIVAVRQLEKAVLEKVHGSQRVIELTGTFSHTVVAMVRSVSSSATSALRRKRALLETAAKLGEAADDEAERLCGQIPALDDRIEQARAVLDEVLTQLLVIESEQDVAQLAALAEALCARLRVAEEAARDAGAAGDAVRSPRVEPLPEAARATRDRKKKRQGER